MHLANCVETVHETKERTGYRPVERLENPACSTRMSCSFIGCMYPGAALHHGLRQDPVIMGAGGQFVEVHIVWRGSPL